jgi:predicted transcriptional regulator
MPVTEKKRVRTSVILPGDVYEKVASLAEKNDISVAWVIRQAIIRFLKDQGNTKHLKLDKKAE